jgi:hypothetical protein
LGRLNLLILLTAIVTAVLFVYLATGQPLVLLLSVAIAVLGVDGLLRTNPSADLRSYADTAVYVIAPGLFTLGAGVFFRYTVSGFWTFPTAILSGVALGGIIYAEYRSVGADSEQLLTLRLILNLAAYLAAFSLYTALYNQVLPLLVASLLVGLVSSLVALDILREVDLPTVMLVVYSVTLGFVMLETRWALNFISLDGWLGGVFILVVFYVASQALEARLTGRLDRRAALEYATVAAVGVLLVVVGRVLSHG